ncbi:MAG: hypothetical protein WCX31_14330 [Salinivirgaceae bacterium]
MKEKKQFLYFNYMRNKELHRAYLADIDILNDIVSELEANILRVPLTLEQKTALCDNAQTFIEGVKLEIRGNYTFPNARERHSLELLGISYEKMDSLFGKLKSYSNPCDIDNEGQLIASERHIEKIKQDCDVYTKNDAQLEIYNSLTKIVDLTNELRLKYDSLVLGASTHFLGSQFNQLIRMVDNRFELDCTKIAQL